MAKIRCIVEFSGNAEKWIYAVKAVRQYTGVGLREARDSVLEAIRYGKTVEVKTRTKKAAIALVVALRDQGLLASYRRE